MLKSLLKTKKGFTLVELIVTMALFAILGLGAMLLLILTASVFNTASTANNAQTATLQMLDVVRLYAYPSTDVTIYNSLPSEADRNALNASGVQYEYIYFENNKFYRIPAGSSTPVLLDIKSLSRNQSLNYEVKFYNPVTSGPSNLLGFKVVVTDSRPSAEGPYTYQTSLNFHNITKLVEPSEGATVSDDPLLQEEEAGVVTDETGGLGGTCIKYAVTA